MPNPLAAGLADSSRTALSQDSVMKSIRPSDVAASSSRRVSAEIEKPVTRRDGHLFRSYSAGR
ncbi:hypothetical protein RPHASCH2410_CH12545 [Rhizobium phaseoli Ch24-10]|nr:hypothetical protein RPHASCH2410_CH12545 [Rhizobium phaseoli Ch24-10]